MTAERFLRWLVEHLCNGGITFPCIDPSEVGRVTDALKTALEIARADPFSVPKGEPTAVLGYTIGCPGCPHGWRGIAFSRRGAEELLREHRIHDHTATYEWAAREA